MGTVGDIGGLVGLVFLLAIAIVHIVFAINVFGDASRQHAKCRLEFAPPIVWALATLLGGVFIATAYWIIHTSNLGPQPAPLPGRSPDSPAA